MERQGRRWRTDDGRCQTREIVKSFGIYARHARKKHEKGEASYPYPEDVAVLESAHAALVQAFEMHTAAMRIRAMLVNRSETAIILESEAYRAFEAALARLDGGSSPHG
jgi:hypothetical protein